jgi:hypothetical protein
MSEEKKLSSIILKLIIIGIVSIVVVAAVELVNFACDDEFWDSVPSTEEERDYFDHYERK